MAMKLAFSTLPVQSFSAEQLAALCARHKMAVEVRANQDGTFTYAKDLPIVDIGTGICLFGYSAEQMAKAKAQIAQIHEKGVRAVRIFIGNFRRRHSDPAKPLDREGIVRAIQELCEIGPEIWLETHNEYATGKAILPLLCDVNRENFGVIWDIMHPLEDGESVAETYASIGHAIRHVHIKDGKPFENADAHDFFYTKLGEGVVPIREIVACLEKNGYQGYYSLEWESMWRPELQGVYENPDVLLSDYQTYMEEILK